jgi:hypothetical protein
VRLPRFDWLAEQLAGQIALFLVQFVLPVFLRLNRFQFLALPVPGLLLGSGNLGQRAFYFLTKPVLPTMPFPKNAPVCYVYY